MSEIPSWFWMVIIAGLAIMLGIILFYTGLLMRESMLTVRELRFVLEEARVLLAEAKLIIDKVNSMIRKIENTVNEVSEMIMSPFQSILGFFKGFKDKLAEFGIESDKQPDPRDYFDPSSQGGASTEPIKDREEL